MNDNDTIHMSAKTPVQTKRPYAVPILSEYGDIRQITQGSMAGQMNDGGMGGPNMSF